MWCRTIPRLRGGAGHLCAQSHHVAVCCDYVAACAFITQDIPHLRGKQGDEVVQKLGVTTVRELLAFPRPQLALLLRDDALAARLAQLPLALDDSPVSAAGVVPALNA